MSKTFELLSESLKEIIDDIEKTGGKNLTQRVVEKTPQREKSKNVNRYSALQDVSFQEFETAKSL